MDVLTGGAKGDLQANSERTVRGSGGMRIPFEAALEKKQGIHLLRLGSRVLRGNSECASVDAG